MHNTYFFGRPGPCLIEWYRCCAFDLLSLKVNFFRACCASMERYSTRTRCIPVQRHALSPVLYTDEFTSE